MNNKELTERCWQDLLIKFSYKNRLLGEGMTEKQINTEIEKIIKDAANVK